MNKRLQLPGRLLALAGALSMAALPILGAAQAQVVGINAAMRNSVFIRGAGTPQPRPAVLRQRVGLNDEVRTGNASQLQILLLDRSVFTVGGNAQLTIDRFVYDPQRGATAVGATMARGAFRFMSGRSLGLSTNRTIRTPVATIGIRGTILEGVVGPEAIGIAALERAVGPDVGGDGAAELIVLRGPGPQTQGLSPRGTIDVQTGGQVVVLDRPSLAVYIPGRGRPPIGPFEISSAGLIRIQQLLFPLLPGVPAWATTGNDGPAELITGAGQGNGPNGGQAGGTGLTAGPGAGRTSLGWWGRGRRGLWVLGGASLAILIAVIATSHNNRPMSP